MSNVEFNTSEILSLAEELLAFNNGTKVIERVNGHIKNLDINDDSELRKLIFLNPSLREKHVTRKRLKEIVELVRASIESRLFYKIETFDDDKGETFRVLSIFSVKPQRREGLKSFEERCELQVTLTIQKGKDEAEVKHIGNGVPQDIWIFLKDGLEITQGARSNIRFKVMEFVGFSD